MKVFSKLKGLFRDDWCKNCQVPMDKILRRLYMLPMCVGHYSAYESPEYYKHHLRQVACKADIPPGVYACEVTAYQCPDCGRRIVKLLVFLPVREWEKREDIYLFEHGELDDFLWGS